MTHCSIVNRDGGHTRCVSLSHGTTTGKKEQGPQRTQLACPAVRRHADSIRFGLFLPAVTTRATYTCKRAERGDTIDSQACVLLPGLSRTDADLT
jgi:hypothetical protein